MSRGKWKREVPRLTLATDLAPVEASVGTPVAAARYVVTSPYAYFADDSSYRAWGPGAVVSDPLEVAELLSRGAPMIEATDGN